MPVRLSADVLAGTSMVDTNVGSKQQSREYRMMYRGPGFLAVA
jgi:hypothetical protein